MPSLIDSISDDQFRAIVVSSKSYFECLKKIGYLAKSGAAYKLLKKRIVQLKISTKHFSKKEPTIRTRENVFVQDSTCDQSTLRNWFSKEDISYRCSVCGQEPFWNGQEMIMILDHINGINNDDRLENLRWVCPNCNSQLPTTNGKNIRKKPKQKIQSVVHQYKCPICGNSVKTKGKICRQCAINNSRKVKRPTALEFAKMVKELGFTQVGKIYGLSGKAVQKWCNTYHIPHTKKELIDWYNQQIQTDD